MAKKRAPVPIWRKPYHFSSLAIILVIFSIAYAVFIIYSWISPQIDWLIEDAPPSYEYDFIDSEARPIVCLLIHLSCFFMAVFIFLFTLYYESVRRDQRQQRLQLERDRELEANRMDNAEVVPMEPLPPKTPSAEDIVINVSKVLGEGSFGVVYEGIYLQEAVAVKTFKSEDDPTVALNLIREIKVMQTMGEHENIVAFKAVQLSDDCKILIALELCPLGSLEKYLRKHGDNYRFRDGDEDGMTLEDIQKHGVKFSNNVVSSTLLRSFARQIASGMRYLASKKVVHGDLAARNVLVGGKGNVVKISDFGFSREIHQSSYSKQKKGPLPYRWAALETLEMFVFSTQSDAWSYGVTLWEIFTLGNIPFPMCSWNDAFIQSLRAGEKLQKPEWAPDKVYLEIMLPCWNIDPKRRPSFEEIEKFFLNYEEEYLLTEKCAFKPTNAVVHQVPLEETHQFTS